MATTSIGSGVTQSGLNVTSGNGVDVQNVGTAVATTVQAGSVATNSAGVVPVMAGPAGTVVSSAGLIVEQGGVDSGATIQAGATELVFGSAAGDSIFGLQFVSGGSAAVTNETVQSGGAVDLYFKGSTATGLTVKSGGTLNISGNATASNTTLSGGATLSLQSPKASLTGAVILSGTGNTLQVTTLQTASAGTYQFEGAVISGFVAGDIVDITAVTSGAAISLTSSNTATAETVNVTSGGTVLETLVFTPNTAVALAADSAGNVEVVACYCRGTAILTDRGEMAVEELRIGDRLVTASGAVRPLRWVGTRSYGHRFIAGNPAMRPVRIAAGALGNGLPRRDLLVSGSHAMFLDGVLIPAQDLVNGSTVTFDGGAAEVHYYHLELDSHDVILAEGAASESYVEDGNRGVFHNAASFGALYSDRADTPAAYCAPRVSAGYAVDAVRTRLKGGRLVRVA